MHNAPAVIYPVGRSLFHGWMVVSVGLLGSFIILLWLATPVAPGWRQWFSAGVLIASVLGAGDVWRRSPSGTLRWDGRLWEWASSGTTVAGHLVVHLDFQSWMVLSLRSEQRATVWLWPERRSDALQWDALRRAVFARRGAGHHQDSSGFGPHSQDTA